MSLEVHLVTPEREVWTGEVQMLIAHGTDGDVGILGGHAPLLVQLEIAPLRLELGDGTWMRAVVDPTATSCALARAPAASDSPTVIIVLPAPVSPVRTVRPGVRCRSRSSMIPRPLMCSSRSTGAS